jgi:REP element-mobilizing transposase RayT
MNRGIARRTVFETRADARYFLSLLAREVRAGRLRVFAFAVLTTHFHLLAASPQGDISGVMRRVLNLYVRRFNRIRRRDGALFRGRFRSRPVMSLLYRFTVMRYIDQNAVQARLASVAPLYPYGSAGLYAARRRPRWLDTDWADVRMGSPLPHERAARYSAVFGSPLTDAERQLVEARLRGGASLEDELDDLLAAAPQRVRLWMEKKAHLADQTMPGIAYVGAPTVLRHLGQAESDQGAWRCVPGRARHRDAWPIVRAGLLRQLAGMTYQDIAAVLDLPQSSAQTRVRQHVRLLHEDAEYAATASGLAAGCLANLAPGPRGRS